MRTEKVRLGRGDFVFRQGDSAQTLFRADTGLVRLVLTTPRGRHVTLRHVLPGDYFGEEVLHAPQLDGRQLEHAAALPPYRHAAEALTPASILRIDPSLLDERELLEISRSLGHQLQRAMSHEVHLQSGDLRHRVVRYLLELVDTPLGAEDSENRLYVRATHELLAEGSGSTRESVSKIVTELRDAGLVETGYRHITLLDLPQLRALCAHNPADEKHDEKHTDERHTGGKYTDEKRGAPERD